MDPAQRSVRARVGDRIVVHGHRVGRPERNGEVSEVLGEDGAPPFMVRWEDDGRRAGSEKLDPSAQTASGGESSDSAV